MEPTNDQDPSYYHRSSTASGPARRTPTSPGYIRLIAQGRFDDAYMLNRESNVFPGILGRTCDRPCEPACRRDRVDGSPVAICRLKRVAADLTGDITDRLPAIPAEKNGKRVACIGAGPVVADRRQRPHAARLRGRDVRAVRPARRTDAHQHPRVPPARRGPRRRDAGHPRHGRRDPLQLAGRPACAPCSTRASTPSSSASARRAARSSTCPGATTRRVAHPHRHRLARVGRLRPRRDDRRAGAHHRRRQHRHGLLPLVAPPRRHGHQGHGPPARASSSRPRPGSSRTPRRRASRSSSTTRPSASSSRTASWSAWSSSVVEWDEGARHSTVARHRRRSPATTSSSPSARRTPSPGSSATSAWSSASGTCRSSTRSRIQSTPARASSSAATPRGGPRTSSGPSRTATRPRSRSTTTATGVALDRAPARRHEPRQPEDGHERVELPQRLQPVAAPEDDTTSS